MDVHGHLSAHSHAIFGNISQNNKLVPHLLGFRPLWEILDPPLLRYFVFLLKSSKSPGFLVNISHDELVPVSAVIHSNGPQD